MLQQWALNLIVISFSVLACGIGLLLIVLVVEWITPSTIPNVINKVLKNKIKHMYAEEFYDFILSLSLLYNETNNKQGYIETRSEEKERD